MAKKNILPLLLIAGAGLGIYLYLRRRQQQQDLAEDPQPGRVKVIAEPLEKQTQAQYDQDTAAAVMTNYPKIQAADLVINAGQNAGQALSNLFRKKGSRPKAAAVPVITKAPVRMFPGLAPVAAAKQTKKEIRVAKRTERKAAKKKKVAGFFDMPVLI